MAFKFRISMKIIHVGATTKQTQLKCGKERCFCFPLIKLMNFGLIKFNTNIYVIRIAISSSFTSGNLVTDKIKTKFLLVRLY